LLGIGGLLGGISFLIKQESLFEVAFLSFGVAGLLLGVAFMAEQSGPEGISPQLGGLVGLRSWFLASRACSPGSLGCTVLSWASACWHGSQHETALISSTATGEANDSPRFAF
jgi:hypothetical protein